MIFYLKRQKKKGDRVRNKIVSAALFVALLSGCASVRPAAQQYILTPDVQVDALSTSKYKDKTLKVANIYADRSLKTRNMFYIEQKRKKYAYSESKWAESPQTMIHQAVMDMMRKSAAFGYVQSPKSKVLSDFLLETRVDEFAQYFSDDEKSATAKVTITFTLLDAKKHTIVMSKTFSATKTFSSLNAAGGAEALSLALSDVLRSAAQWIEKGAE